ncbi:D-3-phosphoglycerate dehydrogenase [Rhizobiales bacterium GAS113]|jgi:D-3-phosphoglycerate dehydrogenase|nr:D-3-phosphoglycerate dehydrogenase [Rhizobiales bacterium GAS113]
MTKIFLTHIPEMLENYYGPRAVAELRQMGDVVVNPTGKVLDAEGLVRYAKGCEIIVSDRQTPGYGAFMDMAPDLVAFLRCAVDIRNIDVEAASRNGILVTQATPGFAASVAELAIGFMIDLARHVSASVIEHRAGAEAAVRMGRQLSGSSLGIIGYGVIAEHLAKLGLAFGMSVRAYDPYRRIADAGVEQLSFEEVLERSDFVVCLAVATPETENLMNAAAFARMRKSAFFLNLSRGNLVDEAALEQALDAKRIAGAALDVGRAPDQKPSLALARRPDVIATPHTAGLTPSAIEHQAFDTVGQVRALIAGKLPPGAVNTDKATRLSRLQR